MVTSRWCPGLLVSGPESDLAVGQGHQPLVGDGYPVGVTTEVMIGLPGGLERAFGVDHPLFPGEFPREPSELHRVCQTLPLALQSALVISLLQTLHKLAPDDLGERPDREQEAVAGGNL
jgi:hypothetical protein